MVVLFYAKHFSLLHDDGYDASVCWVSGFVNYLRAFGAYHSLAHHAVPVALRTRAAGAAIGADATPTPECWHGTRVPHHPSIASGDS
eukprot:1192829-Prorocentrum_minimum.AAC.2